jgi:hypothetical protein
LRSDPDIGGIGVEHGDGCGRAQRVQAPAADGGSVRD